MNEAVDKRHRYWPGALSFIIAGVLFIVGIAFVFSRGLQSGGEATLKNMAEQTLGYQGTAASYGLSDLFLIPAMFTLYFVLRKVRPLAALIATGFLGVGITLDLASNAINLSLIGLSDRYFAGANEVQQAAYVAVADGLLGIVNYLATLDNFLWGVYAVIIGSVMLKGVFSKTTGYLGIVSGILGIVGSFVFILLGTASESILQTLGFMLAAAIILWGAWYILIGIKLYRL